MKSYKFAFLFDRANNWLEIFFKSSKVIKNIFKYNDCQIYYDEREIINNDIVFILGYTKILSQNFLEKNRLNVIVHESALPKGKGFSPVQWQILEGENIIPICLLEAVTQVDSGDILFQTHFVLNGNELYGEIREKQSVATINAISEFLKIYPFFSRKKQSGMDTYYPRRHAKDSELDIKKSIAEQFNLLRVGNNDEWPSFFFLNDKKYIIKIYEDGPI